MHYLVIERFKDAPAIYERLSEKGRMMPEGLNYVSSWIDHHRPLCAKTKLAARKYHRFAPTLQDPCDRLRGVRDEGRENRSDRAGHSAERIADRRTARQTHRNRRQVSGPSDTHVGNQHQDSGDLEVRQRR